MVKCVCYNVGIYHRYIYIFFNEMTILVCFFLLTINVVHDQKYVLTYDYFSFYDGHEICIDFVKF